MIETVLHGNLFYAENTTAIADVDWTPHATCPGVFLKHLIKGSATNGMFSCHLVKVQAGCEISEHVHPKNWELHEVVAGNGTGILEGTAIPYTPGNAAVIPLGQKHTVQAGAEDLYLLAKFTPALV